MSSRSRTDLLPVDAAARAHVEQWMDWQASDFNNSWRVAFQGLVRKNPAFQNPEAIAASTDLLSHMVGMVDAQLGRTAAYIAGRDFTAADIVIGLSLHRWRSIPMSRPHYSSVAHYLKLLSQRSGFVQYGLNGGP
jgi:glutathione S-transferase